MKYSLAIHRNGYPTLDITNYATLTDIENYNEKSLEDIIAFTNDFSCEEELIESLLNFSLIPKKYYDGSIGIRYYKNSESEPRILKYGVSYKEDKNMFKLDTLLSIYDHYLNNNEFMEEFIKQYQYLFRNNRVLSELIANISFLFEKSKNETLNSEDYELYRCKMKQFILTYCTHRNRNNEYVTTISGIRELAMFSINYERKNKPVKSNKFKNKNYFNNLKSQLYHYEELLNTEGMTEEEYTSYKNQIDKIIYDILLISDYDINSVRSSNDEITRH